MGYQARATTPQRFSFIISGVIQIAKAGPKGKYQEWLTPDGLLRLTGWAREGLTDSQIAHNIGIALGTLCEWKNAYPEIAKAIKKGKAPVDLEVENALLKRAMGYDYEETITDIGADGKQHVRKLRKHMPADVTAQIYWLNNRRSDRWRNRKASDDSQTEKDKNAPIFELLKRLDGECGV